MKIEKQLELFISRRAKANHRRLEARRNHIEDLLIKQNHQCHWCGTYIVQLSKLNPSLVTRVGAKTVTYIEHDGLEVQAYPATVDHVVPISEFEIEDHLTYNDISNLVASCDPCNRKRTRQHKTIKIKICVECGKEYEYTKRKSKSKNSVVRPKRANGSNHSHPTRTKCCRCSFDEICNFFILEATRT